jgi:ferric-dicitrate binding protein FerR (iron transport regulator)
MGTTPIQVSSLCLSVVMIAHTAMAQVPGCTAAGTRAGREILHCAGGFNIELEQGAVFRFGQGAPPKAEIDSGAVLIDHPARTGSELQILTPQAVASVRGTTFIVDVVNPRTSVFVISGAVAVARRGGSVAVILHGGDGVDVDAGTSPLQRKRWKPARAAALLARFGR